MRERIIDRVNRLDCVGRHALGSTRAEVSERPSHGVMKKKGGVRSIGRPPFLISSFVRQITTNSLATSGRPVVSVANWIAAPAPLPSASNNNAPVLLL